MKNPKLSSKSLQLSTVESKNLINWIVNYYYMLTCLKEGGRCMKCEGCSAKDCGVCITCKDMKKYGGPGKKKKECVKRVCLTSNGIIKFVSYY